VWVPFFIGDDEHADIEEHDLAGLFGSKPGFAGSQAACSTPSVSGATYPIAQRAAGDRTTLSGKRGRGWPDEKLRSDSFRISLRRGVVCTNCLTVGIEGFGATEVAPLQ